MPKVNRHTRQAKSSLDTGIHFEPLEPRLLLSGTTEGIVAEIQLPDEDQSNQSVVEAQNFTFSDGENSTDSENLFIFEQDPSPLPPILDSLDESLLSDSDQIQSDPLWIPSDEIPTFDLLEDASKDIEIEAVSDIGDSFNSDLIEGSTPTEAVSSAAITDSTDPGANIEDVLPGEDLAPESILTLPEEESEILSDTALLTAVAVSDTPVEEVRNELVFVNDDVADYDQLTEDLLTGVPEGRDVTVVTLDSGQDGIEQISAALSESENIDAVHFVSHGTDSAVKLGDTWLQDTNLDTYADEISGWGDSLTTDADLMFYGCNLAGGDRGRELLESLGELTDADVAASTNNTGHAIFGGDWELEYTAGNIETPVAFSDQVREDWEGLLANPVADAGGPYAIDEGDPITLDASASSDPDFDPLTYRWDIDNDLDYDENVTGVSPTLTWADLQGLGVDDDGVYTITVEVDDGNGGTDTDSTTITVSNVAPTLTTTGDASVVEDGLYTLNLSAADSGDDTITSWTINWGDGEIETIAGNPSSATHTYTNTGFTNNILVSATDEDGTYLQNELLVASTKTDSLMRYENTTGSFLQEFATGDGLDFPGDVTIGPDGNINVCGYNSDDVLRYNATTGAFIDEFVAAGSGGLNIAYSLAFGADGNLYVASGSTDEVLRYNGTTGAFIDDFVSAGSGGVSKPAGLSFGTDGNLYVAGYDSDAVYKYDGSTGAFIDVFVSVGSGGLDKPEEIVFGPDGNLYVASDGNSNVVRYNGTTGAFIDEFVAAGSGGLQWTQGLTFGPDGHLYVGSWGTDNVLRFDGTSGAYIDEYVATGSGGLDETGYISFLPEQQVTVVANDDTPVVTAAQSFSVAENAANTTSVGTVAATDADPGTVFQTWTITSGNGDGIFAINAATGEITVTDNTNLDRETTTAYSLGITVSDGANTSAVETVGITVTDINDNTPVVTAAQSFSVAENAVDTTSVGTVAATDADTGTVFQTWTITSGNGDGIFAINAATGEITVTDNTNLDRETTASYTLGITVSDGTNTSAAENVTVTITDVNESPIADDDTFSVAEDASNGTAVGTVTAADEDAGDTKTYSITAGNDDGIFAINSSTGEITITDNSNLNYESETSYSLTVQVEDAGGLTDTAAVTVNVTNINEAPVADDALLSVAENAANGAVVGTVTVTDPDAGDSLTYSITAGNNDGIFGINSSTGEITVEDNSNLNYESATSYGLTVQVEDSGGYTGTAAVAINITDVNEDPTVDNASFSIDEHSTDGSAVGAITASDPDGGDSLTYSIIAGNDQGLFSIDGSTGAITVNNGIDLDFEVDPTHTLTILVADSGSPALSKTATVTINLNDIFEAAAAEPEPDPGEPEEADPDDTTSDSEPTEDTGTNNDQAEGDLSRSAIDDEDQAEDDPEQEDVTEPEAEIGSENPTDRLPQDSTSDGREGSDAIARKRNNSSKRDGKARTLVKQRKETKPAAESNMAELLLINPKDRSESSREFDSANEASEFSTISTGEKISAPAKALISNKTMQRELDAINDQIDETVKRVEGRAKLIAGTAMGISAFALGGYVLWAFRGISLLASTFASLPVWQFFDPLPVLSDWEGSSKKSKVNVKDDDESIDEEEKKLQTIFDK